MYLLFSINQFFFFYHEAARYSFVMNFFLTSLSYKYSAKKGEKLTKLILLQAFFSRNVLQLGCKKYYQQF